MPAKRSPKFKTVTWADLLEGTTRAVVVRMIVAGTYETVGNGTNGVGGGANGL
ncbi:MAG: hypothetical protein WCF90_02425 [Methanomicrobiales archaeon]